MAAPGFCRCSWVPRPKRSVTRHLIHLSTYGILKGMARASIETYLDALLAAECIHIVDEEFPKLAITSLGEAVMRRQQTLQLALPGATGHVPAPRPVGSWQAPRSSPPRRPVPPTVPSIVPAVVSALPSAPPDPDSPQATPRAVASPVLAYDARLFERLRAQRTASGTGTFPPSLLYLQ